MTLVDPELAEAAALREDQRLERIAARLRRRHRRRRPVDRLDRAETRRAQADLAAMGTFVDVALGRVIQRLTERVRDTDHEAQASRDRLARLRSIEAQTARGR